MDLISSPKTRAELPVTFAWLADTAIAKANKLQEKVGRLRVINDLVSEMIESDLKIAMKENN